MLDVNGWVLDSVDINAVFIPPHQMQVPFIIYDGNVACDEPGTTEGLGSGSWIVVIFTENRWASDLQLPLFEGRARKTGDVIDDSYGNTVTTGAKRKVLGGILGGVGQDIARVIDAAGLWKVSIKLLTRTVDCKT